MIEFQGNIYKSFTALSKEFNVNLRTFTRRQSKGMTLEQCLGFDESVKGRAIIFEGIVYKALKALCDYYNIPTNTYWQRIKRGLSQRQALGIDPYKPRYAGWKESGLCDKEGIEIEKANYFLYEIINNINGKIYIGITTASIKTRWNAHIIDSKTKQTPLYKAMRKYGIENFEIHLISEDARSSHELMEQEIEEIKNRQTTNRDFGYNVASGGSKGNAKQFIVDDKIFPSQQEAAAHFGIDIRTFNQRIHYGYTPERAGGIELKSKIRSHWVILEGKQLNLKDASNILGKNHLTILTRVNRGWTYHQAFDFEPPPTRNPHCARIKPKITDDDRNLQLTSIMS